MNVSSINIEPSLPNSQDDVAILVPSFDGYQDLWKPFFTCFFKYWPDCPFPVYLGSNFQTYEDPRVKPIQIGPDHDYASNLIMMMSQIPHEWVIIIVEDVLLCGFVKTHNLVHVINVGKRNNAALIHLLQKPFDPIAGFVVKPMEGPLVKIPPGLPYRASINLGFWKKSVLLDLLRPGETAWELEFQGTLRSFNLREEFFCISKTQAPDPIFRFKHGVIRGKWTYEARSLLCREGLNDSLTKRASRLFLSDLYLQVYNVFRYFAYWIVYQLMGKKGILKLVFIKARLF